MSGNIIGSITGALAGAVNTVVNTVTTTVGTATGSATDPMRWRGFSHDELYKMLHDGPGATASALPAQRWTEIAGTLADIDANLRGALARSAEGWSGGAASTAYERLGTLADWASTAGANAGLMRDGTQRQAENIAKARADMPAPTQIPPAAPDPATAPAMQVLSLQADQETPDAAKSAGEQNAQDVMATYQLNTDSTVQSLSTFAAPERVAQAGMYTHNHGHGIQGSLTSPSGVIDALLGGGHGHSQGHGSVHHSSYNGGGTSSSGSGWMDNEGYSPRYSSPSPTSGGGGMEFGPLAPGFGYDRDSVRRSGPGRTAVPGTAGNMSGVGTPNGGEVSSFGGAGGSGGVGGVGGVNGVGGVGGVGGVNGVGGVGGVAGTGGAGSAHVPAGGAASGASTSAVGMNPNEMPPPAAAGPNGTMTSSATGGAGAATAGAAQGAGQDKLLGRRAFDAGPGAGQWLSEPEPAMPSAVRGAPARRRDLKPQVRVTETVSVDGEDVELPETVIGEGRDRSRS